MEKVERCKASIEKLKKNVQDKIIIECNSSVCECIDAIREVFLDNLKLSFTDKISLTLPTFWPFVKQISPPRQIEGLQSKLRALGLSKSLEKERAWIKTSMNNNDLNMYMSIIFENPKLTSIFYGKDAIFRDSKFIEELEMAFSLLSSLHFNLPIDALHVKQDIEESKESLQSSVQKSIESGNESRQEVSSAITSDQLNQEKNTDTRINKIDDRSLHSQTQKDGFDDANDTKIKSLKEPTKTLIDPQLTATKDIDEDQEYLIPSLASNKTSSKKEMDEMRLLEKDNDAVQEFKMITSFGAVKIPIETLNISIKDAVKTTPTILCKEDNAMVLRPSSKADSTKNKIEPTKSTLDQYSISSPSTTESEDIDAPESLEPFAETLALVTQSVRNFILPHPPTPKDFKETWNDYKFPERDCNNASNAEGKCAGCNEQLKIPAENICEITNCSYCKNCFGEGESIICPQDIFEQWMFSEKMASKIVAKEIREKYDNALFMLDDNVNCAALGENIKAINRQRKSLLEILRFIKDCPSGYFEGTLMGILGGKNSRLLNFDNVYTLKDLIEINNGQLVDLLTSVKDKAMQHILFCENCADRGDHCGVCMDTHVIFEFDDGVTKCGECSQLYHSDCVTLDSEENACDFKCEDCMKPIRSIHEPFSPSIPQ